MHTAICCIFLLEVCFVSVHNRVYLYVSLHIFFFMKMKTLFMVVHIFFFMKMKNEVTLFMVVELKRVFFFIFREVVSSDACIASVQVSRNLGNALCCKRRTSDCKSSHLLRSK